ncbi:MAG: translational GTPase TypA [Saprospiraceae bacterium]|nr:translational GTPase TypA [Saprospiraceae bacterium]
MSDSLRNVAIIAHVDHGKTTLVDKMLMAGKLFEDHEDPGELIMDSNDLERERGITIVSKNVSVRYGGCKINVIDTPGHADFGGEVERVLNMADGALLLVDAFEGPMPQTRFVLQKAIELGLKIILVINKVDKENCDPEQVVEDVFDLMIQLDASEEQLDFPVVYGSAKFGWMSDDWTNQTQDINHLIDTIIKEVPAPTQIDGPLQMIITALDFSPYIGRIAIGRVHRGTVKSGATVSLLGDGTEPRKSRIKELFTFEGFQRQKVEEVNSGEVCALVGLEGFEIGDTIADVEQAEALGRIKIDEPTMSMLFTINDSPFFGREGKFVTSRHVKERLEKELEKNLALRVEPGDTADSFRVYGRGVLHLAVLIETMRREGYELQVGQPQVILKEIDGVKNEPMEELFVDAPEELSGKIIEEVTKRLGTMTSMRSKSGRSMLEFEVPSRGLIGLRSWMLTMTSGQAVMNHRFVRFGRYKGVLPGRINGSLISLEAGKAIPFSLNNLQERGTFFIAPNEEVYEGQVIGANSRPMDLTVNVTKTKKLTNIRSAGADDKVRLAPPRKFTLEEALEYIQADEYVEVTPSSMRLRKILLKEHMRKRARHAEAN